MRTLRPKNAAPTKRVRRPEGDNKDLKKKHINVAAFTGFICLMQAFLNTPADRYQEAHQPRH
jgi:hypothetical protein